jgi:hypothetical protein
MLCYQCPQETGGVNAVKAFASQRIREKPRECFNSMMRGDTMPAFSFEKISEPIRHEAAPEVEKTQPRGVIIQILDRFVEARIKGAMPKTDDAHTRFTRKLPK